MPVLPEPSYRPPLLFRFGHLQTLYPTLFRTVPATSPQRYRLELTDGDFLDLDYHRAGDSKAERVAIISHGLEGSSRKKYPLGMAICLNQVGWDAICLNFRGCSGSPNRLPRLYHSGVTDDLGAVVRHALAVDGYRQVALLGFSMGGNQTLKYLGEEPAAIPPEVVGAVVFSVPCRLADSVAMMSRWQNRLYMRYFMHGLHEKVRIKAAMFPELVSASGLASIMTFPVFDDRYTAPLHGFASASDYYQRCSSANFLAAIDRPTLLVQAADDPFLPASCYPREAAQQSRFLHLEVPRYGGHVGFVAENGGPRYWSEQRAARFLAQF